MVLRYPILRDKSIYGSLFFEHTLFGCLERNTRKTRHYLPFWIGSPHATPIHRSNSSPGGWDSPPARARGSGGRGRGPGGLGRPRIRGPPSSCASSADLHPTRYIYIYINTYTYRGRFLSYILCIYGIYIYTYTRSSRFERLE